MGTVKVRIPVAVRADGVYCADRSTKYGRDTDEDLAENVANAASPLNGSKYGPPVVYIVEIELPIPTPQVVKTATVTRVIEPTYPVDAVPANVMA